MQTGQVSVAAAGLLNWLWTGAGYFIVGQNTKGIVFCLITVIMVIFDVITCGVATLIHVPYTIIGIVDAVLVAQRRNRGEYVGEWTFF
jgi:TM2 domain-containing membrane protein YozV